MKRERSDSKARPERRGGAASSRARGSRPALQRSRPTATSGGAGKSKSAAAAKSASGAGRTRAAKKAAPASRPAATAKPKARTAAAAAPPASRGASRTQSARVTAAAAPDKAKEKAATTPARTPKATKAPTAPARGRAAKPRDKAAPAAPAPPARPRKAARPTAAPPVVTRKGEADVSDEERVELAKYVTGEQPPRVFEEERFIFPETYGRNRVRLLVKDPHWLFAHWDVDPEIFAGLRGELGERGAALSHLTLKVTDPEHGGGAVIHLPEDARSWYVRADRVRRAYRAELGLTLPSGEYRVLATSNTVRPPQGTPSHRRAARRARYVGPRRTPAAAADWTNLGADWSNPEAAGGEPGARRAGPGPWEPSLVEPRPRDGRTDSAAGEGGAADEKGGASDVHRPRPSGASDLYRR